MCLIFTGEMLCLSYSLFKEIKEIISLKWRERRDRWFEKEGRGGQEGGRGDQVAVCVCMAPPRSLHHLLPCFCHVLHWDTFMVLQSPFCCTYCPLSSTLLSSHLPGHSRDCQLGSETQNLSTQIQAWDITSAQ